MSYRSELAIQTAAHADRTDRAATLVDLRDRLSRALTELDGLSARQAHNTREDIRIRGKAEGVKLALSYVDDALRMSPAEEAAR